MVFKLLMVVASAAEEDANPAGEDAKVAEVEELAVVVNLI